MKSLNFFPARIATNADLLLLTTEKLEQTSNRSCQLHSLQISKTRCEWLAWKGNKRRRTEKTIRSSLYEVSPCCKHMREKNNKTVYCVALDMFCVLTYKHTLTSFGAFNFPSFAIRTAHIPKKNPQFYLLHFTLFTFILLLIGCVCVHARAAAIAAAIISVHPMFSTLPTNRDYLFCFFPLSLSTFIDFLKHSAGKKNAARK